MVIRLVARVRLDDMATTLLYPQDAKKDERIAVLTGIVQLVSAALSRGGAQTPDRQLYFLKSASGVVSYFLNQDHLFIGEGDTEGETGDALKAIMNRNSSSEEDLVSEIKDAVEKPGKEISELWK